MTQTQTLPSGLTKLEKAAPIAAVVGVLASTYGLSSAGRVEFMHSYLFAWIFWVSLSLGCFGMTVLHHMVRGSWGYAVLRLFEAGAKMLPVMAILGLPIIMDIYGAHVLYPWSRPEEVATNPILQHRSLFLNPAWFVIRYVFYFAIWITISTLLTRWQKQQDDTGDASLIGWRANLAAPAFLIFFFTITFAFTDWVMSADARWSSTIYGIWFVVCQGTGAVSLIAMIIAANHKEEPYNRVITPAVSRDLGNLLLMFTMLWAYISLSQFLIQWSGNLPEEITYYIKRESGGLLWLGTIIVLGQFLLPFLLLMSGRTKRTPGLLGLVACGIFFIRILDVFYTIKPMFITDGHPLRHGLPFHWLDAALWVGLAGIWFVGYVWHLRQSSLLPKFEPLMVEVTAHA